MRISERVDKFERPCYAMFLVLRWWGCKSYL